MALECGPMYARTCDCELHQAPG